MVVRAAACVIFVYAEKEDGKTVDIHTNETAFVFTGLFKQLSSLVYKILENSFILRLRQLKLISLDILFCLVNSATPKEMW